MGGVNPVAAPYLSLLRRPSRPASSPCSRPTSPTCSAWSARSRPRWRRATPSSRSSRAAGRCARSTSARSRASPTSRAASLNLLCGRLDELLAPLCGHRDVNAIVDATGDAERAATIDELAAETVKRVSRPAPRRATRSARLEALVELKTAWHPVGV